MTQGFQTGGECVDDWGGCLHCRMHCRMSAEQRRMHCGEAGEGREVEKKKKEKRGKFYLKMAK